MKTMTKPYGKTIAPKYGLLDPETVTAGTRSQFEGGFIQGEAIDLDAGTGYAKVGDLVTSLSPLGRCFHSSIKGTTTFDYIPFTLTSIRGATASFECWYKPACVDVARLLIAGSGSPASFASNNWIFEHSGRTLRLAGDAAFVITGDVLLVDKWQHLAFTNDGTTTKIYVDGHEVLSTAHTIGNNNATGEYIGKPIGATGLRPFCGELTASRFYSTVRTPAQIQASYEAGARLVEFSTQDGIKVSTGAGQTGGLVGGNSPFEVQNGTWSVDTETDPAEKITKILTCDSAGTVITPLKGMYGTWSFWTKTFNAFSQLLFFIADSDDYTTANAYRLFMTPANSTLAVMTGGGSSTKVISTDGSPAGVWTHWTLTRRYDGQITIYRNAALLGNLTAGTNPYTDNTFKASTHFILNATTSCELALTGYHQPLSGTDYSFIKRLGVVPPGPVV